MTSSSDSEGTGIDLNDNSNLAYTGPVYFGTPYQEPSTSTFVYDSGSGYLTVTGYNCTDCSNGYKYYNPNESSTAS